MTCSLLSCCPSINDAAVNGHLDCLIIIALKGSSSCDYLTAALAAKHGHLDCLKFLHEHGCPWFPNCPSWASLKGHLQCLKYAHQNNCPWNKYTTTHAYKNGHTDCLEYALRNGCDYDSQNLDMIHILASNSNASSIAEYAETKDNKKRNAEETQSSTADLSSKRLKAST